MEQRRPPQEGRCGHSCPAIIRIASKNRRRAYDLAIDTTVKMQPIARFSDKDASMPNTGNTSTCVATATPKPTATLAIASMSDIRRDCFGDGCGRSEER